VNKRDFLKTASVVGGAILGGSLLSGCSDCDNESDKNRSVNINKGKKVKLKLATSWPSNFPIMGTGVDFFAEQVKKLSGGSLEIKVYTKNQLVPALAVFDTASTGQIDAFHSGPYYWKGKNSALSVIGGVPFGMLPSETNSWMRFGGGLELWREIYDKYNLYPLLGGNTGIQMGGWFKKEIKSLKDLNGLKMRIPGLGGEVFSKMGVNPILLPAGEIFTALERGTIDATEWVSPALDIKMGFQKVAQYYYTGWHETGSVLELSFNKNSWNKLSNEHKAIIETASFEVNTRMTEEFQFENGQALEKLKSSNIKIKSFPDEVISRAKTELNSVIDKLSSENPDFEKVWKSYSKFLEQTSQWTNLSAKSILNIR
jgi:TRAP-type mannitol/chloroaromatic compound transport system substrate-binding protein